MKLSGEQAEKLYQALQDAYRDYGQLERMVRFQLEESLTSISSENRGLEAVVFDLIKWAEKQDKVLDLVWGANHRSPDNSQLKHITYQLFYITREQWEDLCKLLSNIKPDCLEFACQQSFKSNWVENDPSLIGLSHKDFDDVKNILKGNLIEKKDKITRKIPIILEFANFLSQMPKIDRAICNQLKTWVTEVASQLKLNIQQETQPEDQTLSKITKRVRPYLLIIVENQGSNFLLKGELVVQESDSEIILHRPIYIVQEKPGILCGKKRQEIGKYILKFINYSRKELKLYLDMNKNIESKSLIIELFLPTQLLLSRLENIPIRIAGKNVKLGCQCPLIFRNLERFEIHKEFQESFNRLENNWIKFKRIFEQGVSLTPENIVNMFENYSSRNEGCQVLEQRLRGEQKIGVNIIFSLSYNKNDVKVMSNIIWAINLAGIPFALWSLSPNRNPEELKQKFIDILTFNNAKDLTDLFNHLVKLRGQAYDDPESSGQGLGLLCDNPYRVPYQFKEDNAFIFDY